MLIPSVLVPRENNVLVNPMHTDFLACAVEAELEPFAFDARLLCPPR
jgi:RES domain-containing protein